jgi:hypothetical protein
VLGITHKHDQIRKGTDSARNSINQGPVKEGTDSAEAPGASPN